MANREEELDFEGPTFERERQDLIDAGLTAALAITSLQTIHRANQRKERAAHDRERQEAIICSSRRGRASRSTPPATRGRRRASSQGGAQEEQDQVRCYSRRSGTHRTGYRPRSFCSTQTQKPPIRRNVVLDEQRPGHSRPTKGEHP
jgi:hypothetical protein